MKKPKFDTDFEYDEWVNKKQEGVILEDNMNVSNKNEN